MKNKPIHLTLWVILLVSFMAGCQSATSWEDKASMATSTPLVIPDRTAIRFRTFDEGAGFHIGPELGIIDPMMIVLSSPEDIAQMEPIVSVPAMEDLRQFDFNDSIIIAIFQGRGTIVNGVTNDSVEVRIVYLMEDIIQVYTDFSTMSKLLPTATPDEDDNIFSDENNSIDITPYQVITISKDDLPEEMTFELIVDSEVILEQLVHLQMPETDVMLPIINK